MSHRENPHRAHTSAREMAPPAWLAASLAVTRWTRRAWRLAPAIGPARQGTPNAAEIPAPHGPGWFNSSWDLRCGLEVREGLPGDAKLNDWIEACLRKENPAMAS